MTSLQRGTGKRLWKRVVVRILIAVLIFVLLNMALSAVLFRVLFRRMPPPELSLTYESLDSAAYPRERVFFPSEGTLLNGYWYPAEEAEGTVLIVHGMGSSGEAHLPETVFFLDHGFSVFAYDATGMGDSEGRGVVGLSQSRVDVISAVEYLRTAHPEGPLFLYGHSMGGYGVLSCLTDVEADGVVCLNGFRSPVELMHLSARRYVGVLADLAYPFLCLQNWFTFGSDGNTDALAAAEQADVPVLILNGSEDTLIPEEAKLSPEDTGDGDIEFRTVAGGHTGIWLTGDTGQLNSELMEIILAFYRTAE